MRALDTNADGKLDQGEIDVAVASLRKLDEDGDGSLTGAEIFGGAGAPAGGRRPEGGPDGRRRGPDMLKRLDTDGDGKISKEEAPERMRERFDQIDTNGDGFIDEAEQKALLENMRRRFAEGGGRPEGGSRRGREPEAPGGTAKPKRPPLEE